MHLFSREKWDNDDITFTTENGEIVFYALICIKWGNEVKRYRVKDVQLVERLIGHIHRHDLEWWEVKEDMVGDDKNTASWYLYYYPMRHEKSMKNSLGERGVDYKTSDSLEHILEMFNWMVK